MCKLEQINLKIVFLAIFCSNFVNCFTPEDVAFATQRCSNISAANTILRIKWAYWSFTDKKETHCYVKCLLEKLGLIDLVTRGLDPNKLIAQFTEDDYASIQDYNFWETVSEELSGTCKSYYIKWMSIYEAYPKIIQKAFFADTMDVEAFYKTNPQGAKRRGMTAIDFCGGTARMNTHNDYNTLDEGRTPCYWECVFNHFRYFDAYGRIDQNEVVSDFRNNYSFHNDDIEVVKECVHQSNIQYPYGFCDMGDTLYKCLISRISYTFDVFSKRDMWTATF